MGGLLLFEVNSEIVSADAEREWDFIVLRPQLFCGPGTDAAALSLIAPRQHNRFPKKETNVEFDGTPP